MTQAAPLAETKFRFNVELTGVEGFRISSVDITEGLSERAKAVVVITADEDLDMAPCVGKRALIQGSGLETRTWTMLVGEARFAQERNGPIRYRIELYDFAWPMGFRKNTRKFRNLNAPDIISTILDEHGITHRWELTTDPPVRKYCAQYRETDLAFVERLLEFEGIFYRFDEQGVMIMGDSSVSAPRVQGGRTFELIEAAQSLHSESETGIYELRKGSRVRTGKVVLGDYNWKRPDLALRETATADLDIELERYEYPAGYRDPERGSHLAKLRVEAYRAQAHYVTGFGDVMTFAPGTAFRMGNLVSEVFAGEYLLTHIEHHYGADVQEGVDQGSRLSNRFRAMPLERPFRPEVKTPRPSIAGSHTAMVRGPAGEEIHTDKYGRFRAQLHWDREAVGTDDDSRWLRILQETSSSQVLARVGWEMTVAYIDGDPDRPIGIGRSINGEAMPTYDLPGNKNRMTIKTPSSPATGGFSEIRMDDSAGSQHIYMKAEKDLDARVKNDKTETIGNNETHSVGTSFKRQVFANQTVSIGSNDTRTYGATSELKVMGSRWVTVGGNETIKIAEGQNNTVVGNDTEKVGSVRISIVGSLAAPNFKSLAQSAAMGLIPSQFHALKGLADGGSNALKGVLTTAATNAADSAVGAMIDDDKSTDAGDAAGKSLKGSAKGYFPSLDDLKKQYSKEGLTNSVKGAFSQATGGLSDVAMNAFGKGQNGQREVNFGWQDAQALVSLFTVGGISRTSIASINKVVGGAYIQATASEMNWSSGGMHMETIGGLKLTKSAKDIGQLVEGKLRVNVLGKVAREAVGLMSIESKAKSTITVGMKADYDVTNSIEINGKAGVLVDAGSEIKLDGGGSTVKMTAGSVVLDGPKLGLDSSANIVLNGKKLNLTKG